jgi:phage tail-like protein
MATRKDPYRNSRFKLEIGGIWYGFSECAIADTNNDVIEYREGSDPPNMRKLAGNTKYGNITLKWGLTDSTELWEWRKQVIDGKAADARKNGAIVICDTDGTEKVRWEFVNAWPVKYDPSDLNAKGNDVAIETLELAHEGLSRG